MRPKLFFEDLASKGKSCTCESWRQGTRLDVNGKSSCGASYSALLSRAYQRGQVQVFKVGLTRGKVIVTLRPIRTHGCLSSLVEMNEGVCVRRRLQVDHGSCVS